MAISGQMPWPVTGLFISGTLLALCGVRLDHPRMGTALLLLAATLLFGRTATGSLDLVVGASSFAALLALQRMLAPLAPRTDSQVLLASLLMVAGGAALSADLAFVPCLLVFVGLATFALALRVLEESAAGADEPPPFRAALPRLWMGLGGACLGAVVFFVVFPRLSWNVAARQSGASAAATTGFTGEVRLGEAGSMKTNPRPVLRVRLTPNPGKAQLDAYWIGRALDTFDGTRWSAQTPPSLPRHRVQLHPALGHRVEQEVELLPAYGSTTLVALESPVTFSSARLHGAPPGAQLGLVRLGDEQVRLGVSPLSVTYTASSVPELAIPPATEALDRFRQLPPLDPRIASLTSRVLGNESDPARAAERLAAYLQSAYTYSLDAGNSDIPDPLADFLFVRKKGHCEHFATALAVLLRTRGFATRVVTGFYGGERQGDTYLLRAADAHAWVQVYVPGKGFVTFDATPESFRAGHPSPVLDWAARTYEAIERLWRIQVVDYSFVDQARFAQGVFGPGGARGFSSGIPRSLRTAALALLLLAAARTSWRWLLRQGPGEVERLGVRLERLLSEANPPLESGDDLEAYLARLDRSARSLGPGLQRVLRRYLEARFGRRPLEAGEAAVLMRHARAALKRGPSRRFARHSSL
jgi:transglutaminase-like putative cysteine protease